MFFCETLIHSYMKLKHEQYCNATWIESKLNLDIIELNSNTLNWLDSNSIKFTFDSMEFNSTIGLRFNWIEFKFNWRKMKWKLVEKVIKILLWIWGWQKKNLKKIQIQKDMFSCLFIWEWVEQIFIWNRPFYGT